MLALGVQAGLCVTAVHVVAALAEAVVRDAGKDVADQPLPPLILAVGGGAEQRDVRGGKGRGGEGREGGERRTRTCEKQMGIG